MSKYVGRHQGGAGTVQEPEDFASIRGENDLDNILVAAVDSSRDEFVTTKKAALPEIENDEEQSETQQVSYDVSDLQTDDIGDERKGRKKRASKFGRFLLIYSAVFLVLLAIGLTFFWKYIAAYEISRPEHVIDDFILSMENEDGTDTLRALFKVSEFEDKDAVFDKISGTYFKGQNCTYRKMPGEYTENSPVYIVRSGTADLFKVKLNPKGENAAGFGFQLWEVSSLELVEGSTRTITIEVPSDAAIKVNDIEVPETYITNNQVEYDKNAEENRFNADSYRVLYAIDGIYDKVTVSAVDAKGTELTSEYADDSKFVYDANRMTIKVTAPSDAIVTINGIELEKEDVKEKLLPEDLFMGLEKYAESVPDYVIYEVVGLLESPEITAKDAKGQVLTASEETEEAVVFGLTENEELKKENTQLVTDFIKNYVSFSTNEGENANSNFLRLSKSLLPGTETYKRLKESIEGISWVEGGTIEYRELTAGSFTACGKNSFVCRVSLGISVTSAGNVRKTDSVYTLVFVKSGGVWRVGNMIAE